MSSHDGVGRPPSPPPGGRSLSWLDASLVIAAGTAALGFVKLWIFSHGNFATVQMVLQGQGLGSIAAVWLAAVIPIIVALSAAFSAGFLGEALRENDPWVPPLVAVIALLAGSLLLAPAWATIALGGYALVQAGYGVLAKGWRWAATRNSRVKVPWLLRLTGGPRHRLKPRGYLLIAVVGALVVTLFMDIPWLPRERLHIQDADAVIGYVAGDQGGFALVIEDKTRTPIAVPSEEIAARTICNAPLWGARSLLAQWIWRDMADDEPSCD